MLVAWLLLYLLFVFVSLLVAAEGFIIPRVIPDYNFVTRSFSNLYVSPDSGQTANPSLLNSKL